MKYVVDSSVAFKWFVKEADSDKALVLRDDYRSGTNDLIAPDIITTEVVHAITRAERQGRVTTLEGAQALVDFLNILPTLYGVLPDLLPTAYLTSSKMRIGVYDCLYVALAEREGCEFITADEKLVKKLKPTFSFIIALADLP